MNRELMKSLVIEEGMPISLKGICSSKVNEQGTPV